MPAREGLAFDMQGTLVDPFGIRRQLERYLSDEAPHVAEVWRRKQLEYTFLLTLMERYEDFERRRRDPGCHAAARGALLPGMCTRSYRRADDGRGTLGESRGSLYAEFDLEPLVPVARVEDPLHLARLPKLPLVHRQQAILAGIEQVDSVALDRALQDDPLRVVEHEGDVAVEPGLTLLPAAPGKGKHLLETVLRELPLETAGPTTSR